MGKITGFLEYDRQTDPAEQPLDRIEHWKEFHPRLSEADRRQQGARCMECGVPFCQSGATLGGMTSGCPLHNLVPEWNDLLYTGNLPQALERLLKTNNFPEFTGRVCPALCEAACTCGLHGDPVTVRENELASSRQHSSGAWSSLGRPECAAASGWRWWAPAPPDCRRRTSSTAGATASPSLSGTTGWADC